MTPVPARPQCGVTVAGYPRAVGCIEPPGHLCAHNNGHLRWYSGWSRGGVVRPLTPAPSPLRERFQ